MIEYNDGNVGTVATNGSLKNPATDVLGNPYSMDRVSIQYLDAAHFVLLPTGFRGELPLYTPMLTKEAVKDKKINATTVDNSL